MSHCRLHHWDSAHCLGWCIKHAYEKKKNCSTFSFEEKKKKTKLLALNMQTVTHSTDPVFEDSLTVAWKLVEEFSTWVWVMDLQHLVIVPYVDQSIRNPTAVPLKLHSTGCVELIFIRPWVCVRSFTAQCHLPNISILVQLCLTSRKLNVTHKNSDIYT